MHPNGLVLATWIFTIGGLGVLDQSGVSAAGTPGGEHRAAAADGTAPGRGDVEVCGPSQRGGPGDRASSRARERAGAAGAGTECVDHASSDADARGGDARQPSDDSGALAESPDASPSGDGAQLAGTDRPVQTTQVPEPSMLLLIGSGVAAVTHRMLRRRRA
jgi:hypothetical protein